MSSGRNIRAALLLTLTLAGGSAAATLKAVSYRSATGSLAIRETQAVLAGSDFWLTEKPKFIEPAITVSLSEKADSQITRELSLFLSVTAWGPNGYRAGRRYVALTDSLGNILDASAMPVVVRSGGTRNGRVLYNVEQDGQALALTASFDSRRNGSLHSQIELGGYTGAQVGFTNSYHFNENINNPETSKSVQTGWQAFFRTGQYTLTWKAEGDSLSLAISEALRGETISFSPNIDDHNWGFIPPGVTLTNMLQNLGVAWNGDNNIKTPAANRTYKLVEKIAAANTGNFYLYVDGQAFKFSGVTVMPAAGTVMTVRSAWGAWNADGTVFTQRPAVIQPGDSWRIEVGPEILQPDTAEATQYTWGFSGEMITGADQVEVYLTVSNPTPFSSADLVVSYDPAFLRLEEPLSGSLKPIFRAAQLELAAAQEAGSGRVSLRLFTGAAATPLPEVRSGSGGIVSLKFKIIGALSAGVSTKLELGLNEGTLLAGYQMPAKAPSGVPGDVKGDGKADIFDLLDILQVLGGGSPSNILNDLNGDGRTDIFDLLEWLKIAGK